MKFEKCVSSLEYHELASNSVNVKQEAALCSHRLLGMLCDHVRSTVCETGSSVL